MMSGVAGGYTFEADAEGAVQVTDEWRVEDHSSVYSLNEVEDFRTELPRIMKAIADGNPPEGYEGCFVEGNTVYRPLPRTMNLFKDHDHPIAVAQRDEYHKLSEADRPPLDAMEASLPDLSDEEILDRWEDARIEDGGRVVVRPDWAFWVEKPYMLDEVEASEAASDPLTEAMVRAGAEPIRRN